MSIVVVAKLPTQSREVRDKQVSALLEVSRYSLENESGTVKYAVLVPQDETDDKTVWAIEEYNDQAALDAHMGSPPVKNVIKMMESGTILAGEPAIHMLEYVNDLTFSKPEVLEAKDPFVVFAELEWHPETRDDSFKYWGQIFETSKDESGTFVYGILKNKDKKDSLYTLEAYENANYLWDTHAKTEAVSECVKNTKDWRISLLHNKLKLVGGYLHRDDSKARI